MSIALGIFMTSVMAASLPRCSSKKATGEPDGDATTEDGPETDVETDVPDDGTDVDDTDIHTDVVDDEDPCTDEVCDGVDNDCDGDVDEDDAIDAPTWYADDDEDDYGDDDDSVTACEQPTGYIAIGGDCDDTDDAINPDATEVCDDVDNDCDGDTDESDATDASTWYLDADDDGYGEDLTTERACTQPTGFVSVGGDCDDAHDTAHPGASEVCDGLDNDCDGDTDEPDALDASTWYFDGDGDSYGVDTDTVIACSAPSGYTAVPGDCDDTDGAVNPGATEMCDGIDNDCDGDTDEPSASDASTWYRDADDDGYGTGSDTIVSCTQPSGYVLLGGDCVDSDPTINPGAMEICTNGVDEDCSGVADDHCPIEHCGLISASETWDATTPHLITCDVYVEGSTTPVLTIADGATVFVSPGTDLYIGYTDYGELSIAATTTPVRFTSSRPSPAPGDWDGITIGNYGSGTDIDGLDVRYAGGNGFGNIYVISSYPDLSNITSMYSSGAGLYATSSARPYIDNSTFTDNAGDGIYICVTCGLNRWTTTTTFVNNVLTRNGGYPITLPAMYLTVLDDTTTYTGNGRDLIRVLEDDIVDDATWTPRSVDYLITGNVTIAGTSTYDIVRFTIADGVTLLFEAGTTLAVAHEYASITVNGTSLGVLFTSAQPTPAPRDWEGLRIMQSDRTNTLTGLTVEYGGFTYRGNIYLSSANVTMRNCISRHSGTVGIYTTNGSALIQDSEFTDNLGDGLQLYRLTSGSTPTFTNNVVTRNGRYPMSVSFTSLGELDPSSTVTGNAIDMIRVTGGTALTSYTLADMSVEYLMDGYMYIQNSDITAYPTVTIPDGLVFKFTSSSELRVGGTNYGKLVANGTTTGITFTSASPTPAPGDWDSIEIGYRDQGSVLTGVTIEYAGDNTFGSSGCALCVDRSDPVISDATVRYSSGHGIYATGSVLSITDSDITDNADYGIWLTASAELTGTGSPSFRNSTITRNGGNPIVLGAESVKELDTSSTFSGNTIDSIVVYTGTISSNATWRDHDVPYHITGDVVVNGSWSPELRIQPGCTLMFDLYRELRIATTSGGTLIAVGTPTDPILFTSSSSTPSHGDWDGIYLGPSCVSTTVRLEYVTVEYAGRSGGAVYFNSCNGAIRDSTISYSSTYGIYRNACTPTIERMTYIDNVSGDVF